MLKDNNRSVRCFLYIMFGVLGLGSLYYSIFTLLFYGLILVLVTLSAIEFLFGNWRTYWVLPGEEIGRIVREEVKKRMDKKDEENKRDF